MRRRRLLVAIPGLVTATAGCNAPGSNQSTPTPDVTTVETESAFQQLESFFNQLDAVNITRMGSLDATSFREINTQRLEETLTATRVSLTEIQQAESTPSTTQRAIIYGINIAEPRLVIYKQLARLVKRRARLKELIATENYATLAPPTADITDATEAIITTSQSLLQIINSELNEISKSDLPEFYPLETTRREVTTYTNIASQLRPAVRLFSAWANSLSEASAAQTLFENRDWRGAQVGFATAVSYVETAQTHHSNVDTPPALIESLYRDYACEFPILKSAFAAGRDSARAARAGNRETATNQLSRYEDQFDEYKSNCLS